MPKKASDKIAKPRYGKSEKLYAEAVKVMPGGVSSPVRSFKSVGLSPVFIKEAKGSHLIDVDDNIYIDYILSYGPLIAGHCAPTIRAAVAKQIDKGSAYGCSTEAEIILAKMIAAAMPHLEMTRFVNSGTEATMSAIRLARAATKRDIIVKVSGCYHGHVDSLLVEAGSGALTHGCPSSPGIPASVSANTAVVPFNDTNAAAELFARIGNQVAAIILEPICGNIGVVPPETGYLESLRELCNNNDSLLIFDEVMTGFRVARGGAQSLFNVRPDITCLGKVIGGGLPVGAYGGAASLMNQISPAGSVYQAGTLSGNPISMSAGIATLQLVEEPEFYNQLEALGKRLQDGLEEAAAEANVPLSVQRCGSMLTPFFVRQSGTKVRNDADAIACDTQRYARFFKGMLDRGIMLPPSQFESWFLSCAHTEGDIDATIDVAKEAMKL